MEQELLRAREESMRDAPGRLKAFVELTKPRLMVLLVLVAAAAFVIASRASMDWARFAAAVTGTGLLAAGIFALNQYQERGSDSLMRRTAGRPIPSGRVTPETALAFGAVTTAAALAMITALLGWVAGAVALGTFVSYVVIYTPLKKRTALHTTIGALSGATPPLLGWASARGDLAPVAWILFAILFLWQFPHFLAIDTMYAEDYRRAGIRLLPPVDGKGGTATAALITATLLLLVATSVAPWVARLAGDVYLAAAILAGAGFLAAGGLLLVRRTKRSARMVLRASVLYLPLLFAFMAFNPPA